VPRRQEMGGNFFYAEVYKFCSVQKFSEFSVVSIEFFVMTHHTGFAYHSKPTTHLNDPAYMTGLYRLR
jgi:hypothetical protein